MERNSVNSILALLVISVIAGGGIAYAQSYCYNEYPITGSTVTCDYFFDFDGCSHYGQDIVCQTARCVNTSCQWDGWKMHCQSIYSLCMNPGCLNYGCA